MARRYRMRRGGNNRRKLVWARSANLAPGQTVRAYDLLESWRNVMDWNSTPGVTIRRVRMSVHLYADDPGEFEPNIPTLGLIVYNQDVADPTDNLPNPGSGSSMSADWLSWGMYSPYAQGGLSAQHDVDVKSQRKLEEMRQTLWLVRSPAMAGQDPPIANMRVHTSVLLALP